MRKILIGCYFLIMIGIVFAIWNSSLKGNKNDKEIAAGEKVYNQQCVVCHGKTGKGEGAKIGTALNNQHFLNNVSNIDLYNDIKYGRETGSMPSYGPKVSEKNLNNLVAFIRNWQSEQLPLSAPKAISGNVENGKRLYNLYCLSCHGERGAGKANMGTAIGSVQYLKYTTDKQIWISTAYGRENTRMGPSLKGLDGVRQLKQDDITDIVTYIRSLNPR